MTIRPIEPPDIEAVLAIQRASAEVAQWIASDYASVVTGGLSGWVAEECGAVAGFLVARWAAGDLEILNFAVRTDARRKGLGTSLLREALAWARTFRAERALLEVRASNAAALRFYERHGFQATGRRVRYYAAPTEDALLLTAEIASLADKMRP
ncbi:MAG TPA: ribosomal protein S18-alanine N-acetyltransferase [Candidatus Baltobacteraceae bacterium]|nr:ribosomal protein S18-alanine N-acetyltransferase [Candidatus Baltobacteraceae bacterium]